LDDKKTLNKMKNVKMPNILLIWSKTNVCYKDEDDKNKDDFW